MSWSHPRQHLLTHAGVYFVAINLAMLPQNDNSHAVPPPWLDLEEILVTHQCSGMVVEPALGALYISHVL